MDINEVLSEFFKLAFTGSNFVSVKTTQINEDTQERKDILIKVVYCSGDNQIPLILDSEGSSLPIIMLPAEILERINNQLLHYYN